MQILIQFQYSIDPENIHSVCTHPMSLLLKIQQLLLRIKDVKSTEESLLLILNLFVSIF